MGKGDGMTSANNVNASYQWFVGRIADGGGLILFGKLGSKALRDLRFWALGTTTLAGAV